MMLFPGTLDTRGNGGQAKSVQALYFIILNSCYDFKEMEEMRPLA